MTTFEPSVPGPTLRPLLTKRFVVERAFAAYKLLVTTRVERFETCQTFRVPTFAVVAKTFVVVTALEAYRLPVTFRVVTPVVPVSVSVAAKRFVVVSALEAYTLPIT